MSSQLKKARRTHALDQPVGAGHPAGTGGPVRHPAAGGDEGHHLFRDICRLVPDQPERAARPGIGRNLDESWLRGQEQPLLRAHRRILAAPVRALAG